MRISFFCVFQKFASRLMKLWAICSSVDERLKNLHHNSWRSQQFASTYASTSKCPQCLQSTALLRQPECQTKRLKDIFCMVASEILVAPDPVPQMWPPTGPSVDLASFFLRALIGSTHIALRTLASAHWCVGKARWALVMHVCTLLPWHRQWCCTVCFAACRGAWVFAMHSGLHA